MPARRPNRLTPRTVTRTARPPIQVEKSLPAGLTGNLNGGVRDMSAAMAVAQLQTLGQQIAMPRDPFPYAFGPGTPLLPAPLDPTRPDTGRAEPRIYEYPVSWNIPGINHRLVPWQVLRQAANVGVIRDCIRIRKNEVTSLEWDITLTQDAVEAAQRKDPGKSRADIEQDLQKQLADVRQRVTAFWKKPDRGNGLAFGDWMTEALEEHLVLDALAIYPRFTYGGELYSLEILDGSTIKPLLDHRGGRPLPPYPAYQQILYGFPRGEFVADTDESDDGKTIPNGYDADQLIYKRREVRTHSPYGLSAVEQSLTDVDLWLKRAQWMRAEYTEGVMPAGWLKNAGDNAWNPAQLLEYERDLNDYYGGSTAARQRIRVLPPGVEPVEGQRGIEEKYKPDYDLHLLKLVVAHFDMSIAELGFTEAKGLGSSGYHEGQENVQQRKQTRPDLQWMAEIITDISRVHLAMPEELEFKWLGLDQEDESASDELNRQRVASAGMTLNEWRDQLGRPRYSFPEADMPMIVSSRGGIVYLDGASELEPAGVVIQPPTEAPDAQGAPGAAPEDPQAEADGGEKEPADIPDDDQEAKDAEKAAYRRWARKSRARVFQWNHHTPAEVAELTKAGGGGPKARSGQTWAGWAKDEETSRFWAARLSQALAGAIDTQALAEDWTAARGIGKTAVGDHRPDPAIVADALIWLTTRVTVGGADIRGAVHTVLEEILDGVWTDGYYVGDRAAVWAAREEIVRAAVRLGEQLPADVTVHTNVTATIDWGSWAPGDTDAAKRVLGGGLERLLEQAGQTIGSVAQHRLEDLAEVLAEGLERGLAPDTIGRMLGDVLEDPRWASLVAETEVARAISVASQDRYLSIGVTANSWMTAADQRVCQGCRDNEAEGPVSVGQSFPSGVSGPPGHPRCRCALAPDVQSISNISWPTLEHELSPTGASG